MRQLLRGLRGKHTIVLSSHILTEISETCDRLLVLREGEIVASGMQQPYLMGVKSGEALAAALKGETPEKQILVPIVIATSKNIDEILPTIKQTVFGNELK